MTDRELMQQAIEAMMTIRPYEVVDYDPLEASITALRERLAQPEQEQEPVAWADMDVRGEDKGLSWTPGHFHKTPLYTAPPQRKPEQELVVKWDASAPLVVHPHPAFQAAPPQRKPLTDEDMKLLWAKHGYKSAMCKPFARAIEAAHGIKGEA